MSVRGRKGADGELVKVEQQVEMERAYVKDEQIVPLQCLVQRAIEQMVDGVASQQSTQELMANLRVLQNVISENIENIQVLQMEQECMKEEQVFPSECVLQRSVEQMVDEAVSQGVRERVLQRTEEKIAHHAPEVENWAREVRRLRGRERWDGSCRDQG